MAWAVIVGVVACGTWEHHRKRMGITVAGLPHCSCSGVWHAGALKFSAMQFLGEGTRVLAIRPIMVMLL